MSSGVWFDFPPDFDDDAERRDGHVSQACPWYHRRMAPPPDKPRGPVQLVVDTLFWMSVRERLLLVPLIAFALFVGVGGACVCLSLIWR